MNQTTLVEKEDINFSRSRIQSTLKILNCPDVSLACASIYEPAPCSGLKEADTAADIYLYYHENVDLELDLESRNCSCAFNESFHSKGPRGDNIRRVANIG